MARQIAASLREGVPVTLMAIGAGAVNQAVKAAAVATDRVQRLNDIDVVCRLRFSNATDTVKPLDGTSTAMSRMELHLEFA